MDRARMQAGTGTGRERGLAGELALLGLLALLWGSSYPLIKVGLGSIPPVTLIAIRVSVAAALLCLIVQARGDRLPAGRGIWGRLALQSFLNSFGAWTLLAWGQQHVDSGLAGVLNSTSPIFVFLIALALGGWRAGQGRRLAGALLGLAGVVLIIGPDVLAGLGRAVAAQLAILVSAMLFGFAALHGRHFAALSPVVTAAGVMLVASAVLVPASLVLEAPWRLAPERASILAALALGVGSTAVAMMIYFRLVRTLGPLGVASQAYLRAGVSVALGMALLGERPEATVLAGIAAAVAGVVLINLPARRGR